MDMNHDKKIAKVELVWSHDLKHLSLIRDDTPIVDIYTLVDNEYVKVAGEGVKMHPDKQRIVDFMIELNKLVKKHDVEIFINGDKELQGRFWIADKTKSFWLMYDYATGMYNYGTEPRKKVT